MQNPLIELTRGDSTANLLTSLSSETETKDHKTKTPEVKKLPLTITRLFKQDIPLLNFLGLKIHIPWKRKLGFLLFTTLWLAIAVVLLVIGSVLLSHEGQILSLLFGAIVVIVGGYHSHRALKELTSAKMKQLTSESENILSHMGGLSGEKNLNQLLMEFKGRHSEAVKEELIAELKGEDALIPDYQEQEEDFPEDMKLLLTKGYKDEERQTILKNLEGRKR